MQPTDRAPARTARAALALIPACLTLSVAPAFGQSFQGLGFLPGRTFSVATGVSADGTVVVGNSSSPNITPEAFRWTESTGMVGLGTLDASRPWSAAVGVSDDGSVVAGRSEAIEGGSVRKEGFRWTEATGMQGIGHLPDEDNRFGLLCSSKGDFSEPTDISGDGRVIIGHAPGLSSAILSSTRIPSCTNAEAFRWQDGVMQGLGFFLAVTNYSSAMP
ncbi:MAG TPA: hypothetical protein VFG50_06865 [Rhodothermales bacterium]|nr:hypothetical protein [Rhodothermales bacterium]